MASENKKITHIQISQIRNTTAGNGASVLMFVFCFCFVLKRVCHRLIKETRNYAATAIKIKSKKVYVIRTRIQITVFNTFKINFYFINTFANIGLIKYLCGLRSSARCVVP